MPLTPERRRELYEKPSSTLTDLEIVEYMEGSMHMVPARHIMETLLNRFKAYYKDRALQNWGDNGNT